MRVLHLAAGNRGGAYQAAVRLNDLLVKNGLNSEIISSDNRRKYLRILSKVITFLNRLLTKKEYGIMSILSLNAVTQKRISEINPDVIHIHNWFNLLSIQSISRITSIAPVVLTLHDERLITGGCHNHLNCTEIGNACTSCPALTFQIPRLMTRSRTESNNILRDNRVTVVVPSNWMSKQIHQYVNSEINTHVIPNPAQEIFYTKQVSIKQDTTSNRIKIGFIAANPWVELKGLKRLLESLSRIKASQDIDFSLEIVGEINSQANIPSFAKAVGIKQEEQIVEFLDEINFLVVSSFSENYPNIITEAQLRGTVVISTNVGGIPEMIIDEETGFLQQKKEDFHSLLKRALQADPKKLETISRNAKAWSLAHNSPEHIFSNIISVYNKAISNG